MRTYWSRTTNRPENTEATLSPPEQNPEAIVHLQLWLAYFGVLRVETVQRPSERATQGKGNPEFLNQSSQENYGSFLQLGGELVEDRAEDEGTGGTSSQSREDDSIRTKILAISFFQNH